MRKLLLTLIALLSVHLAIAQQCNVSFSTATNGMQVTVTNTTNWALIPGSTPNMWVTWGDNSNSFINYTTNSTVSHTYTNNGTYTITLWGQYFDTLNNQMQCFDSTFQNVIVNQPCASSIATVNNGNGSYSFTANNLGGGTGITYSWNFGDGGTGTGASVNHTYVASGTYTVSLTATGGGCTHNSSTNIYYFNGTLNCANLAANFTTSGTGLTKSFVNTSTPVSNIPAPILRKATWNFGDGSPTVSNVNFTSHTYTNPGSYTVKLINEWVDTFTQAVYCIDSTTQLITVAASPNLISGIISWDSTITNTMQVNLKVWLIVMDSAQNTLTAVDSAFVSGSQFAFYSFLGHPAGSYRTKAAIVSGTTGANQFIPTYHNNSAYWSNATVINHTGTSTINKDIYLIPGSFTGGPGFIGGNISLGANKGTTGGVPNILVALRNATNDIVRFTYTDANGDYSFGNIPAGSYSVYPEHMNYITVPSAAISIASGHYNVNGINFKHTPTHIIPIATNIAKITGNLFNIYPNPSTGNVTINWSSEATGIANIHVADITGRVVYSTEAKANGVSTINLAHLNTGVYFIKIATDKAQHTERLMIQH
ncbi:MAG TPA: PKD domain-containing protein [Flavipsychrobacter sp.]|nr:PKD domain-containing protein [Flavipsychrobacter sp.]